MDPDYSLQVRTKIRRTLKIRRIRHLTWTDFQSAVTRTLGNRLLLHLKIAPSLHVPVPVSPTLYGLFGTS